jgi:hypothetical protein
VIEPYQPDAAHLKEPGQRFCWTDQQAAIGSVKVHAVIADQSCEGEPVAAHFDQLARELRLARTRRTADQNRARTNEHCGSMHG